MNEQERQQLYRSIISETPKSLMDSFQWALGFTVMLAVCGPFVIFMGGLQEGDSISYSLSMMRAFFVWFIPGTLMGSFLFFSTIPITLFMLAKARIRP